MVNLLIGLTVLAFLFVLVTLIMGAKSMGGKDEAARVASNIWMRRRVQGQVVAILLLMLTLYLKTKS